MKRLLPLIVLFVSCGPNLYTLPNPPERSKWKTVSLIPGQEQRDAEREYRDVRAQILRLYSLLSSQRFQESAELFSIETQDFLKFGSGEATVAEVLASGKVKLSNGGVVDLDPVSMLLAKDVSKLTDEVDGVKESETKNRKEVFAELEDGSYQRIVMIREGGKWVLHRTRLGAPFKP